MRQVVNATARQDGLLTAPLQRIGALASVPCCIVRLATLWLSV